MFEKDSTLKVKARVEDLLQHMTLEEKIAQLGSIQNPILLENGKFSKEKAKQLLSKGIGQITHVLGGTREVTDPREAGKIANEIQRFLIEGNSPWHTSHNPRGTPQRFPGIRCAL